MLKSMVNILSKRRKLLATTQSDLREKFASYRRNPLYWPHMCLITFGANEKGQPRGKSGGLLALQKN